ncbi:zinc-binding dehydrogenase [Citrobacter sp. JGM124]|uniref:zinc-binding dehydrogenase n=1 Tax=Citrobacter sp. JGM124 TaxID=2799789 RepID=UPI00201271B0|nr:zinc-binding dehydrogenase [Citrobacter sp. JGM124]
MMQRIGQIQPGEKVLILGASGGVGVCCLQLAKLAGATVIACAGSEEKGQRLRELGADEIILFGMQFIQQSREGSLLIKAGKATVRIAPATYFNSRFGDLPSDYDGTTRMVALSLKTDSLNKVKQVLLQGNVSFREYPEEIIVEADNAFNLALRFHL